MKYQGPMAKSFRTALLNAIKITGIPLTRVAEISGVSYEQLKKIKQRETASTNVDDAVKIANVFGVTLAEFLEDEAAIVRSEIVNLYMQLSEAEREILLAAARGRASQAREADE